jgi:hypothetical protein
MDFGDFYHGTNVGAGSRIQGGVEGGGWGGGEGGGAFLCASACGMEGNQWSEHHQSPSLTRNMEFPSTGGRKPNSTRSCCLFRCFLNFRPIQALRHALCHVVKVNLPKTIGEEVEPDWLLKKGFSEKIFMCVCVCMRAPGAGALGGGLSCSSMCYLWPIMISPCTRLIQVSVPAAKHTSALVHPNTWVHALLHVGSNLVVGGMFVYPVYGNLSQPRIFFF